MIDQEEYLISYANLKSKLIKFQTNFLDEKDLKKPQIGVGSMWFESNPCNVKLDILSSLVKKSLDEQIRKLEHVSISIIKNSNLDILIDKIKNKLKNKFISNEDILITRERHRQHLNQCVDHLKNFNKKKKNDDFDKAAEDLRLAIRHLGMIVGKVDVEELLGSIFNDFCIGK